MSAREETLAVFESAGIEQHAAGDLAARLGAEIRAEVERELRDEFENDLARIREQMFDLGVRTAIELAQRERALAPESGKRILPLLNAAGSRAAWLERLRAPFGEIVEELPEQWSEISDVPIPRTEEEKASLVGDFLALVERELP